MAQPPLRLAEMIAALSLATDLGMGQPMEQALRTSVLAVRLGERLGLGRDELAEVYYVALLRFIGCTADAHEAAAVVGGDDLAFRAAVAPALGGTMREFMGHALAHVTRDQGPLEKVRAAGSFFAGAHRIRAGVAAHCELAENLAARLGLGEGIRRGLAHALERWDGKGLPHGIAGDAVALAARIVFLARDVEILNRTVEPQILLGLVRRRRGAAYDPAVADAFLAHAGDLLAALEDAGWQEALAVEPAPHAQVPADTLDAILEVFADFADLKSPYTLGHSRGVAALSSAVASVLDLEPDQVMLVRRAGLLHDLGRTGIPNGIWDRPGPLREGDWERVRLHAYYSERILIRATALAPLAPIVGMHHERLDGSGYHRGAAAAALPPAARVLAAADVYQAMSEPRPHRTALLPDEAARLLTEEAESGRLDPTAVSATLAAAGQPRLRQPPRHASHRTASPRAASPAGLTEREVEVLRLICRGGTKKQVAAQLILSPATVDHHVRHIYEKIGVATRAGAALFAVQHGLLPEQPA